jgi:putative ABC transport system permease protein
MNLIRTAKTAIKNMLASKMRAWLSSLGIIIGVFSVVVLLAVGEWTTAGITSRISSLGTNLLTITPWASNASNVRAVGGNNRNILLIEHADMIATMSGVALVAPVIQWSKQVIYGTLNTTANISGVTPEFETVKNVILDQWLFVSENNYKARDKVAVIGYTVSSNLFPDGSDPIWKTIRIGNTLFTIIGTTSSGSTSSLNSIYIPLSTAQITISGTPYLSNISVSVKSPDIMSTVQSDIQAALLQALHLTTDTINFQIQNQADLLSTVSGVTDILQIFLGGVAGISLIVGGIGVMNILLVTVSERTKEIGIRKAIGAKSRDIIEQFLVESVILTVFGGIIGIALSYGIVALVNHFVTSITATITSFHIILALSFSVGVGLFFGIFPAYKAAKMKPIDALRSE